jgi:CAAX prenyl protease-like protein
MRRSAPAWLAYIAPLVVFLILSQFEMLLGPSKYPLLYAFKIAIVAGLTALLIRRGAFPELKFDREYLPAAAGLGVVLCALWLGIDAFTPHIAALGGRSGYDPWIHLKHPAEIYAFLLVRFAGLVVVAPIIEEIFYRSFLLRFAIAPSDFRSIPIGKFDLTACVFAVVVMAAGHPEWLAAAFFSFAMNLMIYRTKSLFACVATHAATNLALGIYVIMAHAWQYW